jgi:hypothetical protein
MLCFALQGWPSHDAAVVIVQGFNIMNPAKGVTFQYFQCASHKISLGCNAGYNSGQIKILMQTASPLPRM